MDGSEEHWAGQLDTSYLCAIHVTYSQAPLPAGVLWHAHLRVTRNRC